MSPSRPSVRGCGGNTPLIVVEHLEEHFSRWLALEYRHSLELSGGCLAVTNAGGFCDRVSSLVGERRCFRDSITTLRGVLYNNPERVIVLDPRAEKPLKPGEAAEAEAIVVGGILGDHPPRGRTWELLTRRAVELGMKQRNIGPEQFSIDGAVYVALEIARGRRLEEIRTVSSPSFTIRDPLYGSEWEVTLPFAYPLAGGKPLLAPGLLELLRAGLAYEEYRESRRSRERGL